MGHGPTGGSREEDGGHEDWQAAPQAQRLSLGTARHGGSGCLQDDFLAVIHLVSGRRYCPLPLNCFSVLTMAPAASNSDSQHWPVVDWRRIEIGSVSG